MKHWLRVVMVAVGVLFSFCGKAHPSAAEHIRDITFTFEGYDFSTIAEKYSKLVDAMEINGVKLSASNHRDLFHPILFGESIPQDRLDSIVRSYVKRTGVTPEVARTTLISYRREFYNKVVLMIVEETGLPKQQAGAFAGIFHITHLLGDGDPVDNFHVKSLPTPKQIIASFEKHLDVLYKGGGDDVVRWVKVQKEFLKELLKLYPEDSTQLILALKRSVNTMELGKYLHIRWGKTLGKAGHKWSDDVVRNVILEAKIHYKNEDIARRQVLTEKTKRAEKFKLEPKRYNKLTTQRINKAQAIAESKVAKETVRPGVLQRLKSNSGEVVEVLTVSIEGASRQVGRGLSAGASAGVLTLVFSQGTTYAMYQAGAISDDDFIAETEKNCGAALVAGTSTFVLVTLGVNPTGWVILGVGFTADVVYGLLYDQVRWVNSFSLERDWIFGELPTEIQRRKKMFEPPENAKSRFDFPDRVSVLNWMEHPEISKRTTPLNFMNSPEIKQRSSFLDFRSNKEIKKRKTFLPAL